MTKFSIIVPVYNVEKYLPKCLDSLVNQTYKNIEIICINDGSTDNSLAILNEYAQKDIRIKIINQENQGVSVARNNGIDNATGDYILFVDADDYIDINTCNIISKHIETVNADVISFQFDVITTNKIIHSYPNLYNDVNNIRFNKINNDEKDIFEILVNIPWKCIWDKAYKKNFLITNKIKFNKNLTHAEDSLFMMDVFLCKPLTILIQDKLYFYKMDNPNSAIHISNNEYVNKSKKYLDTIMEYSTYNIYTNSIKAFFMNDALNILVSKLCKSKLDNKFIEYKSYIKNIISNKRETGLYNFDQSGFYAAKLFVSLNSTFMFCLYKNIIRPIGKYCIVLPYRRIKQIFRGKNV